MSGESTLIADPAYVDFGSLDAGATAMRTVQLRNSGTANIVVDGAMVSGAQAAAFMVAPLATTQLSPSAAATVEIVFTAPVTPQSLAHATLVISSDAVNPSLGVSLSGASAGCVRSTCQSLAVACGIWPDGCGATVDCGTCDAGALDAGSVDGGVDGGAPDAGCMPRACGPNECGSSDDGCGGQTSCPACVLPSVCGGGNVPNQCDVPVASCGTVPPPGAANPPPACPLPMPPAQGVPCAVPTPGTQYYVSTAGDDANDGLSPTTPWKTLCKALAAVPSGNTVRVAQGTYLEASITLARALTLKGGYDPTFATWDPDAHPTVLAGRVTLSDDDATVGGFRLLTRTDADWAHVVLAGKLVRNYVEMLFAPGRYFGGLPNRNYALVAAAGAGKHVVIACNDLYARPVAAPDGGGVGTGVTRDLDLIELGNVAVHNGDTTLTSNRACVDRWNGPGHCGLVDGYGSCQAGTPARVTLTNNILLGNPSAYGGCYGISFYGCEDELQVNATNNTVLSNPALYGYPGDIPDGGRVAVHWRITNNIFAAAPAHGNAFDIGTAPDDIVGAEGNLIFGFDNNVPSPTPLISSSNDFTGTSTLNTVFTNWSTGDLRPLMSGPGASGALNVYGQASYGNVTADLLQRQRSPDGGWARGALLP